MLSTRSACSLSHNQQICASATQSTMPDVENLASAGECDCHICVEYHKVPVTPTAAIESLFDGSASGSCSPLWLALRLGEVDEVMSSCPQDLDSTSQQSDDQEETSAAAGSSEEVVSYVQDPSLRHAHRQSQADATNEKPKDNAYALRALQDVEHGMLNFRDALSQLRIERADALSRLHRTHERVENIVKSASVGICVMLHQPMIDPQRSACGHYFCLVCIIRRQKKDDSCPCCGELIEMDKLQQVGRLELVPTLEGWKVVEQSLDVQNQRADMDQAAKGSDALVN